MFRKNVHAYIVVLVTIALGNYFCSRNAKLCSKRIKRTHSSDFIFRQSTSGKDHRVFDDEENNGWCSTCTSSDDSDHERWDKLE